MTFFYLAPWIVFFPVIGLLVNIIFGDRFSEKAIGTVASLASGLAFVVSVLLAYSLTQHPDLVRWTIGEWIHVGTLQLDWTFRVDTLSVTMMLVVSGVGTLIHIYAIGYMHEDVRFKNDLGRYRRFFVFLNLFIAVMMILVSGDSYLMLFVGWEGVGLCSFLLIGFWYEMDTLGRPSWANSNAAKKALIANRIGDFGFLMAAFLMFWAFGSLQFDEVFQQAPADRRGHPRRDPAHHPVPADRRGRQIGADPAVRLAAGCHGRPDPGLGADPCRHHGHRRCLPGGAFLAALFDWCRSAQYVVALVGAVTALFAATIAAGQYRYQEGAGLLDHQPVGFHGGGGRHGRLRGGHVPPGHARLLQGAAVPFGRFGHPRHGTRPPSPGSCS